MDLTAERSRRAPTLRVLVADDCPINQMLAGTVLARWAISPLFALSGRDAVRLYAESRFDLVLRDIEMPDLDGFEATSRIRAYERGHHLSRVPIVAFTNSERASNIPLLQGFGLDDLLRKPSTPNAMFLCLSKWCPDRFADNPMALPHVHRGVGSSQPGAWTL